MEFGENEYSTAIGIIVASTPRLSIKTTLNDNE